MKESVFSFIMIFISVLSLIPTIFCLCYFPKKSMSKVFLVIGFIFFFYNFMMIMVLPIDIYYTYNKDDEDKDNLLERIRKNLDNVYTMNFTILFYGNKILISFLLSYIKSGEFSLIRKILMSALTASIQVVLLMVIMPLVLTPLMQEYSFLGSILIALQIYNLVYAYIYIGVTIVKLPQNLYLFSDIDRSVDYYQFKTHKKNLSIKKNKEKVIEYLYQCKLTKEFIQKKEESGEYNDVEEMENEKKEDESNDNINNNIENSNDIKSDEKKKKDKKKKIKVKELINNKDLLDLLESHIKEIIRVNEIDYDENKKLDKNIIIFISKSEIIDANQKLKEIERDNEKHKDDIPDYYKKWNYYKTLQLNLKALNEKDKDGEEQLNEEEENFIPSQALSKSKLNLFMKCHRTYYISLMILSIIGGIIIILSENTLFLPVNISAFSIIFRRGLMSYFAYFIYVICLFFYSTYSLKFTKLKLFGDKFKLSSKNKTNTLSFLSFIGNLSDFSGAVCTNIVKILKHGKEKELRTVIEEQGAKVLGTAGLSMIQKYVSLMIIVFVVITYFKIIERICKKKTGVQFNIESEERDKYINEGKDYLMKLNKEYLGEFRMAD